MNNYTVKYNTYGGITEVRFKPSFTVDNYYNASSGKQMLNKGNFRLDGWQWDSDTGELYQRSVWTDKPLTFEPRVKVSELDDRVNELLRQYLQWLEFERIGKLNT